MPQLDLVDETFVVADPRVVAAVVADPARWPVWFPDLTLTVTRDRGVKGQQWAVAGAWSGSAEIWLEPMGDGVLLHLYLRLDPAGAPLSPRRLDVERRRRAVAWKKHVWALKDALEGGRRAGEPRLDA
ncbi:MAG: polyketide cyclase / dehydrase and lipid transport [Motilibacteraceae bacterium]